MSASHVRRTLAVLLGLVLLAAAVGLIGCSAEKSADSGAGTEAPKEEPYTPPEKPEAPKYSSWVVSIVDDQESSQGGMTYTIALNLNATNPTPYKYGTYTGTATAKTTTTGNIKYGTLEAEAIANSTQLEFTLNDPESGQDLASLNTDALTYSGTGTITMKAAGTAHLSGASGGFANTSAQPFTITATGDKVTMDITIDGKKFTFNGTISGRE